MQSKMDEFRDFVNRYPKIRDDVRSGKRTWQNIYEEWVLYGEQDVQWSQYQDNQNHAQTNNGTRNSTSNMSLNDSVKNIVSYIQKINPDSLNRTLNTIQKVIQIAQTVGTKHSTPTSYINSPYNDWWD